MTKAEARIALRQFKTTLRSGLITYQEYIKLKQPLKQILLKQ